MYLNLYLYPGTVLKFNGCKFNNKNKSVAKKERLRMNPSHIKSFESRL